MNIIILTDYCFVTGGAAQVAISSANALADAGLKVTYVASSGPTDPAIDQQKVRIINFAHYDLLSNPSKISAAWHGIWDSRCADKFGDLLDGYNPAQTVIHLHTWVKSLSSSVVREAHKRGFKIVCTLHDYFSVCPNGGLYNYQKMHACDLVPMSLACLSTHCDSRSYSQKLWRVARQAVQKQVGGIPDDISAFITISDYSEKILRKWLPSNSKFYRVYNPIDIEKKISATPAINDTFTFVGRLSPEKGALLFAAAARKSNVTPVFVGSGPDELNIRVRYPESKMLGWQNREGVINAIMASRALVFPSLWHETQGLVVTEAAALGIPTIVSDSCAAKDNIVDGKTGLLFRSGDLKDLAEKIQLLHENKELSNAMGLAAYKRYWESPCTQQRHVSELLSCYEKIMTTGEG